MSTTPRPRPPSRSLFAAALAVAMGALVTACGAGPVVTDPSASADTGFPVTVEHVFGATTVEVAPQRVVTVGLTDQDAVLALGVVPVGASKFGEGYPGGIRPWARAAVGDAPLPELIDQADGIPFEQIAALAPDVIVALYAGLERREFDLLQAIAPTVAAPVGTADFSITWQEQQRIVGQVLGRSAQAEQIVADTEALFADARAEHPEFSGMTALRGQYTGDVYYASGSLDTFGYLLEQFGFSTPEEVNRLAGEEFFAEISPERLDLYEADVLLMQARGQLADDLLSNPLFIGLDVSARGAVIYDVLPPTDRQPAFSYQILSALSLPYVVDNLVPRLAAAADGDPATAVPDGPPVLPPEWVDATDPLAGVPRAG